MYLHLTELQIIITVFVVVTCYLMGALEGGSTDLHMNVDINKYRYQPPIPTVD